MARVSNLVSWFSRPEVTKTQAQLSQIVTDIKRFVGMVLIEVNLCRNNFLLPDGLEFRLKVPNLFVELTLECSKACHFLPKTS